MLHNFVCHCNEKREVILDESRVYSKYSQKLGYRSRKTPSFLKGIS
jgi:hypothetical protein